MLDIFIGLSLVFLLYSLLASSLLEIIAQLFSMRNRMLVKAIRRMLSNEEMPRSAKRLTLVTFIFDFIISLVRIFNPYFLDENSFTKAFFDSSSIRTLSESNFNSKPSYIDASTFAAAIIRLLRGTQVLPSSNSSELIRNRLYYTTKTPLKGVFKIQDQTMEILRNYFSEASGDIEKFKALLEDWFNATMERANGWYKKQAKILLFIIGFFLAAYYNIDTLKIYNILTKKSEVRLALVNMALSNKEKLDKIWSETPVNGIDSNKLATDGAIKENINYLQQQTDHANEIMGIGHTEDGLKITTGIFLTAIAISLGASFWFDLLNKLVSLRSTGEKPVQDKVTKRTDKVITVG